MPERTVRDSRSVPARPARHLLGAWRFWAVALAISAIVVVPIGFEVGIRLVPPDAVRVTASSVADGHMLVTHEITDPRIVADLYDRINSLPLIPEGAIIHCGLPGPMSYDFSFTRRGVVIEDAAPGDCTPVWSVSRGGIVSGRWDLKGQTVGILAEAQLPE
jgi:hypothetical protein